MDSNRLTQKTEKRGSHLFLEGTTKYPYTHKHNSRYTARAFIVPIACV